MVHLSMLPALPGTVLTHDGAAGHTAVYESGSGNPLLLIHSVNAAASGAEVRPLYEHYKNSRRVFAIDLPGFGLSDRSDRDYSIRLMTHAVHDAVNLIQSKCGTGPIDALAVSLSCEFLARAAVQTPDRFRSLAFVSPTGFRLSKPLVGAPESPIGPEWIYRVIRGPGWGKLLFRGLTRPAVIRYFLKRTWGSGNIDEALWQYDVITARQEGAHYAPLYFLSAHLFSADIHNIYRQLSVPLWVSHGVRGDFTRYELLDSFKQRNWRSTVYPTGAICYFEQPDDFIKDYDTFLSCV